MRKAVVKQIAAERIQPEQVCTWLRVQEEVCAPRHFMLTQVGDNELLPVQFMSALHACGNDRMTLRRVAADDEYEVGLLHVGDGTRIAAVADGPEQTHGCRRLAIAGTIVDIVRANHGSRQLLHEVALFIRTLGRRDESEGARSI